ncbi:hypothetical protein GCM10027341_34970 [Spirosoma knui]
MSQPATTPDARLQTITNITKQVWSTFSDTRHPPLVKLVPTLGLPSMASFKPKPKETVFINEKLYDICRTFGQDSSAALAIVIGHELTHYHANHKEWLDLAQDGRMNNNGNRSSLSDEELATLEALADRQGVLHAFLAGYNSFRLVRPLYERLYKSYSLPNNLPGYPNKPDRIKLSLAQVNSARPDALLVDAATFLFAVGDYALVEPCLTETIHRWPLASLQNNLAALYLKKALNLTSCQEMPFRLPVEWDSFNRLLTLRGSTTGQEMSQFLELAHNYATQAHKANQDYAPAALNLAIIYLMKHRYGTAEDLLEDLTQQSQNDPNIRFVKAVLRLKKTNRLDEFRESFSSITGAANESFNRAAMDVWPACPNDPTDNISTVNVSPESSLGKVVLPFATSESFPITVRIPGQQKITLNGRVDQESSVDLLRISTGRSSQYDVLTTTSSSWQTTLGLRVNQSEETITKLYGLPDTRIDRNAQDRIYHYKRAGLVVTVKSGLVYQLVVYHKYP